MKKSNILFLILFLPLLGLAQEDFITAKFANYHHAVSQEKVLLTTDRPAYTEEEMIWFKVYIVDPALHVPLAFSSVVYMELRDENNILVLQAKIALKKGIGSGSFKLPKEMSGGKYHLIGYTNWMKNFDQSFFARKELIIASTVEAKVEPNLPMYDIQLFPEGGNLVNGLKSKIAFKVVNNNNIGENLGGALVNGRGDTLSRFSARKYGMGTFEITPSLDAKVVAVFKLPNGKIVRKELPQIYESGIVINLNRSSDGIIVVNASMKGYRSNVLRLVAQTRNQISFNEAKSTANGLVSFQFPESELKEGITQLTIFDDSNRAICERLYFKKPNQFFSVSAVFNQASYANRAAVSLSLNTKEQANVSISIYKQDELNIAQHQNLYSNLWLGSELKGDIENASFYLDPTIDSKIEADILMLTQGWRRFKWNDILTKDTPTFQYPPEQSGFVIQTHLNSSKPINTYATVLESTPKTLFAQTDSVGNSSYLASFYGKKTLIFQTDPHQDSISKFSLLNSPFLVGNFDGQNYYSRNISITAFASRYVDAQVQARFNEPIFQQGKENELNIQAVPTMVYHIDDYTKFPTIGETIKEYIKGVSFRKQDDHQKIRISYKNALNSLAYMTEDALVLFDGVPTFNIDDILAYRAENIERISVVQEKYHDNGINMGGVFSITSKDKTLSQFKSPNALVIDYEGFQQERVFYSPKYSTIEERNSKLPDFRNLLYWNPTIQTFPNQPQEIKFYTGDRKGKYTAIIEGLAENGKATYNLVAFEVF